MVSDDRPRPLLITVDGNLLDFTVAALDEDWWLQLLIFGHTWLVAFLAMIGALAILYLIGAAGRWAYKRLTSGTPIEAAPRA
jgi:hypothetical protein